MILDKIEASTRARVARQKREITFQEVKEQALAMGNNTGFPFQKALDRKEIQFICEVKKASPSKGIIAPDFPYEQIAREYEAAGAAAISVLTEPEFFQGSSKYLRDISRKVKIPLLRKDFIIDAYQIYEARLLGASAVLLIAALLDLTTLGDYLDICEDLGMSALVEVHDEAQMEKAVNAGAKIIGVNNRNLKNFTVDITNSTRLRGLAPEHTLFVAESGIKTRSDIQALQEAGVNGVLIGETLMRSADKKAMLDELRGYPL